MYLQPLLQSLVCVILILAVSYIATLQYFENRSSGAYGSGWCQPNEIFDHNYLSSCAWSAKKNLVECVFFYFLTKWLVVGGKHLVGQFGR